MHHVDVVGQRGTRLANGVEMNDVHVAHIAHAVERRRRDWISGAADLRRRSDASNV